MKINKISNDTLELIEETTFIRNKEELLFEKLSLEKKLSEVKEMLAILEN